MKTADDILSSYTQAYVDDPRSLFEWGDVIEAMKIYARLVAEETLKDAAERIRDTDSMYDALETPIITP